MIIGIGHNMQVGKDTAANALCRDLGFRKVSFADKLKEFAMAIDPIVTANPQSVNLGIGRGRLAWAVQGLGFDAAKQTYTEVREFLQRTGVAAREIFGEDFWVEQAMKGVAPGDNVVFPDVRFENEAEAIHDLGGLMIKIQRPGFRGDGHVSEIALADWDGWDHIIDNDGSVVDLERTVVELVRSAIADQIEAVDRS